MCDVNIKFNIGDRVWLIYENKAVEKTVTMYDVNIDKNKAVSIYYELDYVSEKYYEDRLFPTKEELLKSL